MQIGRFARYFIVACAGHVVGHVNKYFAVTRNCVRIERVNCVKLSLLCGFLYFLIFRGNAQVVSEKCTHEYLNNINENYF